MTNLIKHPIGIALNGRPKNAASTRLTNPK
jgi:hypothetical protein